MNRSLSSSPSPLRVERGASSSGSSELPSGTHASEAELSPGRSTCYSCFRPRSLCYCDALPRLPNATSIVIVQHPREQFHPINTARMVEGSLERCQVIRGPLSRLNEQIERSRLPEDAAILYPSADAVDLADLEPGEAPSCVVVLDGTWHQAKTLLRDLPGLSRLRRVRFTPERPSEYRIRKEPQDDYLSTLESIAYVLERIERGFDVEPLRELFRRVIDRNIEARRREPGKQRLKLRGRGVPYRLPELLLEDLRDVVLVYSESTRGDGRQPGETQSKKRGAQRCPLILTLKRPGEKEPIVRFCLRVPGEVPSSLLEHLGLTREEYLGVAGSFEEVREHLRPLLSERDRLVAWTPASTQLVERILEAPVSAWQMKSTYCDWKRAQEFSGEAWGSLTQILEREGLAPVEPGLGRAERRLLQIERMFLHLREQALRHELSAAEEN